MSLPPIVPGLSLDPFDRSHRVERFRSHWKSVVAFGVVTALFGLLAMILAAYATLVSVLMIGVLMVVAGFAQLAIGFRTRSWGRFLAYEVAGLIYFVAGLFAVFSPLEASIVLTLLLGAGLIATGLSRVFLAAQMHGSSSRGVLFIAGGATAFLGLMIILGWPGNSLFILGTLLGIDLLFQGVVWTIFGLRLKPAA